jgi:cytochrome b561
MSWRNSTGRYGTLAIGLHWLMFVLIAAVFALMELREIFPRGSDPREAMKSWHYALGLAVLLLALLRIALQATGVHPHISPEPPAWIRLSARLMHFALYLLMLGMPLLGWLLLSAEGEPVRLLGWQLPALLAPSEALAEAFEELHEAGAVVGYFLIGFHAAAALFHHYRVRDDTLRRMLP